MPPTINPPGGESSPDAIGRRFGDHAVTRQSIFNNALGAIHSVGTTENTRYRLQITDPGYQGQEAFSPNDLKHARLTGRTLARRLMGTVSLFDKASNQLVDQK